MFYDMLFMYVETLNLYSENASWSDYGEWSSCSVSCDLGLRTRRRSCDRPAGVQQCEGESVETEPCNTGPCRGETPELHYGKFSVRTR